MILFRRFAAKGVAPIIPVLLLILVGAFSAINAGVVFILLGGLAILGISWFFPRSYCLFIFLYVVLVPKIGILSVPGTYVAVRGEDLFIAIFLIEFLLKRYLAHQSYPVPASIRQVSKLFFIYLMICLIAVVYGIVIGTVRSPLLGMMYLFRKFEYFSMIYVALGYFHNRPELKYDMKFVKIIDFSVIVLIVIGFLQKLGIVGAFSLGVYSPEFSDRIMSTFSGPYEYSGFLLLITPLYIYRLIRQPKKLFSLLQLVLIGYSIFLTQSRSSLVIFGILMILESYWLTKSKAIWTMIGVAVITSFLLLSVSGFGSNSNDSTTSANSTQDNRFSTLDLSEMVAETKYAWNVRDYKNYMENGAQGSGFVGSDLSYTIRMEKWFNLLDGFLHNPLFGIGLSSTGEAVDGNYIRILTESGLIGTISWLSVYVFLLSELKKQMTRNSIKVIITYFALLSLFLGATFIDVFESSKLAMTLWFFAGWCLSNNFAVNVKDKKVTKLMDPQLQ